MVYIHDGQRLDALMKRANVANARLAEAAGKSDQAVGKWLRTGKIARESIPAICRALNCSSDELLGITPIGELLSGSSAAPDGSILARSIESAMRSFQTSGRVPSYEQIAAASVFIYTKMVAGQAAAVAQSELAKAMAGEQDFLVKQLKELT